MRHDVLADVLSAIKNGDVVGAREANVPVSNMAKDVLRVLQAAGFIGEFELIDDRRGGKLRIQLLGNVNNGGAIRPRFSVKAGAYEKWERRYLPAAGFGLLIVSTSNGVMTHSDAKSKHLGGKLLAYMY